MNETNYWKQFFCTGKVEDYLKYKQYQIEDDPQEDNHNGAKDDYAGFYHSNRDSYKD